MPVIDIPYEELKLLSGLDKPADWFIDRVPMTGASFEGEEEGLLRFEFFPNRPDHYSVEGIARTMKSLYSSETYVPDYSAISEENRLIVDRSVEDVRPVIVCSVVRGLKFTDKLLHSLIDLQEKLHITVGRKRRKVAVGIHDLRNVKFPFSYAAHGGSDYAFYPLDYETKMTLADIIEKHEKGKEFGWILGEGPFPLITDADGTVLSMPPIINGNATRLTDRTTDVFVDVTGTSREACSGVLNIITAALADRGGSICDMVVENRKGICRTPDLAKRRLSVKLHDIRKMLGVDIDGSRAIELLERMGYNASLEGNRVTALVQPYRMDVMHPVDMVEDVAVGYGFGAFGSTAPREQTVGELSITTKQSANISELLIGYGYTQVVTFMISGAEFEFRRMNLEPSEGISLRNPVLEERDFLRTSLLPGMLLTLEANKHNELPQRIFEIGDVHAPRRIMHFAAVSIHPKATFAECKSLVDAIGRDMGMDLDYSASTDPRFIEGRQMSIVVRGEKTGILGELHPEVITNFNLYNPIVAVEFGLGRTLELR